MKNIFLLCNAHIDPMWLWTWDEGAAETISTFRTAADFCEEYDGFVFNHNESLLYEWVEEYEPELFERIKKLVAEGKWKIMGGWYLQPDCTMLSGESFIRQISYGREYFKNAFGVEPKTAINFDPFGHTRGLVQILKKTGFNSYIVGRPDSVKRGDFIWRGFDGSEVIGHRTLKGYNSLKGQAVSGIKSTIEGNSDKTNLLMPWGIGDHGGGPSRIDMKLIKEFMEENRDMNIKHSDCDEYFATVERDKLEVLDRSLVHCMVGCYTSMVRIKQANRRLENKLELWKQMAVIAGEKTDKKKMEDAEKALMLSQFHDTLPGSMIKKAEDDTLNRLGFAEEICGKQITRLFFKLSAGQNKCKDGEIPVLVYNPMPYKAVRNIEVEFQLENQNWAEDEYTIARVRDEQGNYLPTQNEKEDCSFSLDWRKKVVFRAELEPMTINRFDCELTVMKDYNRIAPCDTDGDCYTVSNDRMSVKINRRTGLLDEYIIDGKSLLKPQSAVINAYSDDEDPWGMRVEEFQTKCGSFSLMSAETANAFRGHPGDNYDNVMVIENGDVRTKIQAIFEYGRSVAVVTYTVPKADIYMDIDVKVFSNDANKLYKLVFDTTVENGKFVGQTTYGTEELDTGGKEVTFHEWCGFEGEDKKLYVLNNGTYAGSANGEELSVTLLRTPVYSSHPICFRPYAPHDRMLDHIDMGERSFGYRLTTEDNVDSEAASFNMPPYAISFFPSGHGEKPQNKVEIDNKTVILSTLQNTESGTMLRLYNTKNGANSAKVDFMGRGTEVKFDNPYEVKTLVISEAGVKETDMLGR